MADPERKRETRDVSGFSRVTLAGMGVLRIVQENEESLTIEASPAMLEKVTSEVADGELTLGLRKGSWLSGMRQKDRRILLELTMREVSGISLSGVGDVEAGSVHAGRLELKVSGAGTLMVEDLTAESLVTVLSGTGSCEVAGRVGEQDVTVSGAGSYGARKLESATARALVSGAGSIVISARDTLDATVSGVGNIECHGDPTVFRRVTGVGKVSCICDDD
ncbi:MAG: head GIN domain-containing protein [Candidatus Eisenbacteria bacterium]